MASLPCSRRRREKYRPGRGEPQKFSSHQCRRALARLTQETGHLTRQIGLESTWQSFTSSRSRAGEQREDAFPLERKDLLKKRRRGSRSATPRGAFAFQWRPTEALPFLSLTTEPVGVVVVG
jgi:hypothetical protein